MVNNLTNLGRYRKEEQFVFLNNTQIPGIQGIGLANNENAVPVKFIGLNSVVMSPNGPQEGTCNVDYLIIDTTDAFLPYATGTSGFNLFVVKDKNKPSDNYGLTSGYITQYSTRCSIGEIPRADVTIASFGNIGSITTGESSIVSGYFTSIQSSSTTYNLKIPGPGSISITFNNDITLNRVLSYELSFASNRQPIYPLGDRVPTHVLLQYPINVDFTATFDSVNYSGYSIKDFPCSPKSGNLNLILKNFTDDTTIQSFAITGLTLVQENYRNNVDGNIIIDANYKGYILRPS